MSIREKKSEVWLATQTESVLAHGTVHWSLLEAEIDRFLLEMWGHRRAINKDFLDTSKRFAVLSGACMMKIKSHLEEMTTSYSFGSLWVTESNLLQNSASIKQLLKLLAGVLNKEGSWPLAVVLLISAFASGTPWHASTSTVWTLALKYATWCSQGLLTRS